MRKCHLFEIETKYDSGTHQEEEEEEQRLHDLRQLDLKLPSFFLNAFKLVVVVCPRKSTQRSKGLW